MATDRLMGTAGTSERDGTSEDGDKLTGSDSGGGYTTGTTDADPGSDSGSSGGEQTGDDATGEDTPPDGGAGTPIDFGSGNARDEFGTVEEELAVTPRSGDPVSPTGRPDLPDPLLAGADEPGDIDPDGGVVPTVLRSTQGPGADTGPGDADDTTAPDEDESFAEDFLERFDTEGDEKGTSAADGFRQGVDLTEDGSGPGGEDDLLFGRRPSEDELLARLGREPDGGTGGTEVTGGGGGGGTDATGGGFGGPLTRDAIAEAGTGGSGFTAPVDPGGPPPADDDGPPDTPFGSKESLIGGDVSLSGGAPVASSGGEVTLTQGQKELAKEYEGTYLGELGSKFSSGAIGTGGQVLRESGADVAGTATSADGVSSVVKREDGTIEVSNTSNNTKTVLNPDGSSTTTNLTTGEKIDESDPTAVPAPDEAPPLPDDLVLDHDFAGLNAHRGGQNDPGTETQPDEGDPAFGAGSGSPTSQVPDAVDVAHGLFGQPGGPDDFGNGAGGGSVRNPEDGAVDPGPDDDAPPQTDGPEQDPFDRGQEQLESPGGSTDDGGALLVPGRDLREVDDLDAIRDVDPSLL